MLATRAPGLIVDGTGTGGLKAPCGSQSFSQKSSDNRHLPLRIKLRSQHAIFPQGKKPGSLPPPKGAAEKWGSLEGAPPRTPLPILYLPSDRKRECSLLGQRRGGPHITNAVSWHVRAEADPSNGCGRLLGLPKSLF